MRAELSVVQHHCGLLHPGLVGTLGKSLLLVVVHCMKVKGQVTKQSDLLQALQTFHVMLTYAARVPQQYC